MRNRKRTNFICILATGAALGVILLASFEFGPSIDGRLHSEIGRALAREALSLLPPGGEITVVTRDTEAFPQPALDILLKGFRREVRQAGAIAVTTKSLPLDPLRPVEVPPGDFYELIRRSDDRRVIVSLLGPPALTAEQRGALGSVQPKIVAVCSGNLAEALDLGQLFDSGLLHVALINRPMERSTADTTSRGAMGFDQLYTVVRGDPGISTGSSQASR